MDDKELTPAQRTALKLDTIACAAAESFIDAYYQTIKTDRSSLAPFYCAPSIAADGITSPQISWNSESYVDGAALQQLMHSLGYMHFKVETLDANVLNPRSIPASELPGGSGSEDEDLERRMSILIVCAGSIRLGEQLKGPLREFAESFVLVPNLAKLAIGEGQKRHIDFKAGWDKQWLIQTQNFTFTEWTV
ncbi:hypothetical protein BCR34DRAFT_164505 [Clohesyomyces aquaticus]|uniref:NTF2 domain-containing protein n=1 Tax=Clohesyomyces aquaticus TaxID=1231657 RepID=A0A1Y1YI43_9PLEO|nr:hypothetical protein BCR34DRAFT_164505 [Clohesyomyces aquaticus]